MHTFRLCIFGLIEVWGAVQTINLWNKREWYTICNFKNRDACFRENIRLDVLYFKSNRQIISNQAGDYKYSSNNWDIDCKCIFGMDWSHLSCSYLFVTVHSFYFCSSTVHPFSQNKVYCFWYRYIFYFSESQTASYRTFSVTLPDQVTRFYY